MYAKIIKDHLGLGDVLPSWEPRDGDVIINQPSDREDPLLLDVRLLDDDRELYYEALADDESLEPLLAWAMIDSGATILQVRKDGKWEDVIS